MTLGLAWRRRAALVRLRYFVGPRRAEAEAEAEAEAQAESASKSVSKPGGRRLHPEWAGATFPLVATATHAAQFAVQVAGPVYGRASAAAGAARGVAWGYAALTLAVVVPVDALFLAQGLPRWMRHGLPPAPPNYDGGESGDGDDAPSPVDHDDDFNFNDDALRGAGSWQ